MKQKDPPDWESLTGLGSSPGAIVTLGKIFPAPVLWGLQTGFTLKLVCAGDSVGEGCGSCHHETVLSLCPACRRAVTRKGSKRLNQAGVQDLTSGPQA